MGIPFLKEINNNQKGWQAFTSLTHLQGALPKMASQFGDSKKGQTKSRGCTWTSSNSIKNFPLMIISLDLGLSCW